MKNQLGVRLSSVVLAGPDVTALMVGLAIPTVSGTDDISLVAAMLGATVMTHNLFLHSHLVQVKWLQT